jgi:hypothetical protein
VPRVRWRRSRASATISFVIPDAQSCDDCGSKNHSDQTSQPQPLQIRPTPRVRVQIRCPRFRSHSCSWDSSLSIAPRLCQQRRMKLKNRLPRVPHNWMSAATVSYSESRTFEFCSSEKVSFSQGFFSLHRDCFDCDKLSQLGCRPLMDTTPLSRELC